MTKKYIPGVIIVEGVHDVSKLSNLYDFCYVITNGYDIPKHEIDFILSLSKDVPIYVLVDKDEAGEKIRERINSIGEGFINIRIKAPKESKKKGIAECSLKDIKEALDKYTSKAPSQPNIDLYSLGLIGGEDSEELRDYISKEFNLGITKNTNLIKRINLLGLSEKDIREKILCKK